MIPEDRVSNQPTLVVLGASGDLAARLLFPALLSLEHRERLEDLQDHRLRAPGVDDRSVPREPARRDRHARRRRRQEVLRQVHRSHRVPRRRHLGRVAARLDVGARRPRDLLPRAAARRVRRRGRDDREGRPRRRDQRVAPARDREAVRHRPRDARSRSTSSCTSTGAKTRSSASTTSSARRRCRTCSCSGSRTGSSSRCCNSGHVDEIQITVAETLGVEGRSRYYDGIGALRDMVQNHLIQMMTFATMEPPALWDAEMIRDHKVEVLKSVRRVDPDADAVRGQYTAGLVEGEPRIAYRAEPGVDPDVAHRHVRGGAAARRHVAVGGHPGAAAFGQAARGQGARGRVPLPGAADAPVPPHAARARRAELAGVPHEPGRVHRAGRAHQAARPRARGARVGAARRVRRPPTTARRRRTSRCCSTCWRATTRRSCGSTRSSGRGASSTRSSRRGSTARPRTTSPAATGPPGSTASSAPGHSWRPLVNPTS